MSLRDHDWVIFVCIGYTRKRRSQLTPLPILPRWPPWLPIPSMLMDLFYDTLPTRVKRKRRIHFHQFMIDVHKHSHAIKSATHLPSGIVMSAASAAASAVLGSDKKGVEVDPIEPVARELASEVEVLCFDEFQVSARVEFVS